MTDEIAATYLIRCLPWGGTPSIRKKPTLGAFPWKAFFIKKGDILKINNNKHFEY